MSCTNRQAMQITDVGIILPQRRTNGRLLAFAWVVVNDAIRINEIRIVLAGTQTIVSMPTKKLSDTCDHCCHRNILTARFCNNCGSRLDETRAPIGHDGRPKIHVENCHPISAEARAVIVAAVMGAYRKTIGETVEAGGDVAMAGRAISK